ncbi:MAG: hypothetical protein DWQ18_04690 [Crenarchaeota archaeon]|nr:MAG: hypothetical protein DWQ17_08440 [Thermoproteota archaeon]RDJ34197.1 MAG: hypothetical protein DWQ18_04690 [Thermoproteota archaeon]RDJ36688.1 MAG: hypothetical protein DWQ13_05920 [Thermoproteota archaeon]RDJ37779.1 MAG: hypothetical protein DWQ19_04915 [Thermoproteota archaeon]
MEATKIGISIIIPIFTGFLFSGIFADEIFTDFDIIFEDPPNNLINQTTVIIKNTGVIQSKNTMISMEVNTKITEIKDNCLEGDIIDNKELKIIIAFQRMSPKINCEFTLLGNEFPKISNIKITADDRSAIDYPSDVKNTIYLLMIGVIGFVEVLVIIYFYAKYLPMSIYLLKNRNYVFTESESKISRFLITEFGKYDLRKRDSIIVNAIYKGKITKEQIISFTKLHSRYVTIRLKKLKKKTVVIEDGVFFRLHPSVENYLKKLGV